MKRFICLACAVLSFASCFSFPGLEQVRSGPQKDSSSADDRLTVKDLLAEGPAKTVLTSEEKKLYDLTMAYRAQKGLSSIPLSKSLSFVARIHVRDLAANPQKEPCNAHSWSTGGPWSAGCYTPDHKLARVMWDKPGELTSYKGNGYEIARGASYATGALGAADSLEGWKGSPGHHAVIINDGPWKSHPWKAIGIGIFRNYAVIWFGDEADPEK